MQLLLTLRTGEGTAYISVGQVTRERLNAKTPCSMYMPSNDPWFELNIHYTKVLKLVNRAHRVYHLHMCGASRADAAGQESA